MTNKLPFDHAWNTKIYIDAGNVKYKIKIKSFEYKEQRIFSKLNIVYKFYKTFIYLHDSKEYITDYVSCNNSYSYNKILESANKYVNLVFVELNNTIF